MLSTACGSFQWQGLVDMTETGPQSQSLHSLALQRAGLPVSGVASKRAIPKSPMNVALLHFLTTHFTHRFLLTSLGGDNTGSGLNGEITIILFASLGISFLQEKEGN